MKQFLKDKHCWVLKYWGGAPYTKSGIPDLLVCCCGQFLGIELKAERGKPSDLQMYNLRKIEAAGGFGVLLYPEHFELFKQFIEQIQSCQGINYNDYPFLCEWDHIKNKRKKE